MAQAQTVAPSPTLIIYFNSLDLTWSHWRDLEEQSDLVKVYSRIRTEMDGQGFGCWFHNSPQSLWGSQAFLASGRDLTSLFRGLVKHLSQLTPTRPSRGLEGSPFCLIWSMCSGAPLLLIFLPLLGAWNARLDGGKASTWPWGIFAVSWHQQKPGGGRNPGQSIWESSHSLGHPHQPIMSLGVAFEIPRKYPFGELVPHAATIVWALLRWHTLCARQIIHLSKGERCGYPLVKILLWEGWMSDNRHISSLQKGSGVTKQTAMIDNIYSCHSPPGRSEEILETLMALPLPIGLFTQ